MYNNVIKKITFLCTAVLMGCLIISGCATKKNVEPEEVVAIPQNASSDTISKELGATPSSQETNGASGISADNYENSTFAGYDGKISFYYNEDGSVLYYKWFINEKDEKKAKEIYSDVCQALSGSYGDAVTFTAKTEGAISTVAYVQ